MCSKLKHSLHEGREAQVTQGASRESHAWGKWRLGRVSKSPPQTYRKGRKLATAENCQVAWKLYREFKSCGFQVSSPMLGWALQRCSCFWVILALLSNPSPMPLFETPIKTHWFIKLYFGATITLLSRISFLGWVVIFVLFMTRHQLTPPKVWV